ncbi:MAG: asparagine synthase (glutamine-hydrolyzing), partial [Cytophagales bacterium]|nr:asparagine synthase (glutamine-hydrolyzing) [Cytophagales bacterium]
MCGIAGFATSQTDIFSEQDLLSLTHALAHRGPDHEGIFYNGRVGLGHRRLSIIDLSSHGNQPFYSQNGQFIAVFNGEIYNYQELRKQLNIQLQSGSDTEVLVELFAQKGPEILKELNGMFAFAMYDTHANKLFFARDRVGKKPLYYFHQEGKLVFSSELKSFLEVPTLAKQLTISSEAVAYFLHLGYVPEPFSIYQQVKKFPAGCWGALDLSTGQWEIHPFWQVEEMVGKSVERDELRAKTKLKDLLESATAYRMIADVPCGSFLSGGIDSSVVTAMASKVSNERLKTFSIGFKNWDKNEAAH